LIEETAVLYVLTERLKTYGHRFIEDIIICYICSCSAGFRTNDWGPVLV